jgi:3'-phosphoadenosine 5'-phosphosulfate sulfotransferase (PAPS reductase)/FAD synthetase
MTNERVNRHNIGDLQQMQSLPLEAKIIMSKRRISEWYDYWDGEVYVSFSGGKDSTVLKHLVETTSGVYDVPVVFVDTGLEYPEVRKFATERADVVLRPEMRFDQVIKQYGYPVASKEVAQKIYELRNYNLSERYRDELLTGANGRKRRKIPEKWKILLDAPFEVSRKCCDVMKKHPAKKYERETGRKAILGTMAAESASRMQDWIRHGCNAFEDKKRPSSKPLSFWTEQDILKYLRMHNLPYASVYGDIVETPRGLATTGCDRTGCMFCMFGCTQDGTPNRFQRMKETHPRQYDYCMRPLDQKGLGLKEVLEYIGVPYE